MKPGQIFIRMYSDTYVGIPSTCHFNQMGRFIQLNLDILSFKRNYKKRTWDKHLPQLHNTLIFNTSIFNISSRKYSDSKFGGYFCKRSYLPVTSKIPKIWACKIPSLCLLEKVIWIEINIVFKEILFMSKTTNTEA